MARAVGLKLQESGRHKNQVCSSGIIVLQLVIRAAPVCTSSALQLSGSPGTPQPGICTMSKFLCNVMRSNEEIKVDFPHLLVLRMLF